jgi:hypothetical protein
MQTSGTRVARERRTSTHWQARTRKPTAPEAGGARSRDLIYNADWTIDEVAVYNKALSAARVQAHDNATTFPSDGQCGHSWCEQGTAVGRGNVQRASSPACSCLPPRLGCQRDDKLRRKRFVLARGVVDCVPTAGREPQADRPVAGHGAGHVKRVPVARADRSQRC